MTISLVTRMAGTLFIAGGLAACIDVTVNLEVLSETTGRATTEISMDREFYDLSLQQGSGDFCDEDGVLTVTDTAATCVTTRTGSFDELLNAANEDEPAPTVVAISPGVLRVTFPTGSLAEDFADDGSDPQTLAMMQQFFEGRTITFRVSGGGIVESNMEIAPDGKSASFVVSLLDLISNTADLPEESYAVVNIN